MNSKRFVEVGLAASGRAPEAATPASALQPFQQFARRTVSGTKRGPLVSVTGTPNCAGQPVTEIRRPHLGNGFAAGRHHQRADMASTSAVIGQLQG